MNNSEAIRVLESVEEELSTGGNVKVKKIQVVQHFRDNGPSLKEVLLCEEIKDLPVLVFSIAGKTRGGKSFLLNLMIKYLEHLESQDNGNWINGVVPSCFTWRNGLQSITHGLWICPKIFKLEDQYGNKIGVMFLDTEGMFDGEATDAEIIAMSGISAAISYIQIFNMKEKITGDYLESVVRNLIKGIEELDSEVKKDLREDYKLMFVVRDWIGEDEFTFGLKGGEAYIQNETKRGTREYQQLWEVIQNTFRDVKCLLLPDPGRAVTRREFNESGELGMLEQEFLDELKRFVEDLFKPGNLILPSAPLTGQDIYKILMKIDGKIADEDLSFLNIFTEHGNINKVENWRTSFEETLSDIRFSDLLEAKTKMSNIIVKAERTLRGKSRETYLAELTEAIEGAYNRKVIEIIYQQYENSIQRHCDIEKKQRGVWPDINRKLQKYLCGNNETRKNANLVFLKKSAAHYYTLLHESHEQKFKAKCSTKNTLEECAKLDDKEIKSFKECEDFINGDIGNKESVYSLWFKEYQSLRNKYLNILLQRIEEITKMSCNTLKTLRRKQYEYFESFTLLNKDEDNSGCIVTNDELSIAKKVGYGMFGPPEHVIIALQKTQEIGFRNVLGSVVGLLTPTVLKTNTTGYSKDQESKIWPIVKKIKSISSDKVTFSCVFVVYDQNNGIVNVPIFRVKMKSNIKYIDSNCRMYNGWDDFLKSNTLPDVVYCYPLNGTYSKTEGFGVAFSKTPASETASKVLKVTDTVGKTVTGVAGIAGCVVLFGVTAPIVGGVAVVGGAAGGLYGIVRGIQKMKDKKNHDEPIRGKDVINFVANSLSVVGAVGMAITRAATFAAEGTVILGTRLVGALSSINSLAVVFTDSNDTSKLISLIAEIEDNSLKILFYFGATTSEHALEVIRESLKLEPNISTCGTLLALVEHNCIQSVSNTGEEDKMMKYVSQNTTLLVKSLLTATKLDVRDIVLEYCDIYNAFQCFVNQQIRKEAVFQKVQVIMGKLFLKLEDEIPLSKIRILNLLCQYPDIFSCDSNFIQMFMERMDEKEGHHLVLAIRYLTCSLTSALRKANIFFNNIDHKGINLKNHYLSDVLCHPLHEVTQQIQEIVEQTESAIDLNTTKFSQLDCCILRVLRQLKENSNENWSVHQLVECLINITFDTISRFETIVNQHKKLVKEKMELSCIDLGILFNEIGLEEYNYGLWVLNKVLGESEVNVDATDHTGQGQRRTNDLLMLPAWSGILDCLYCYCSMSPVSNLDLIKQIEDIQVNNYEVLSYDLKEQNCKLSMFIPCDEGLCLYSFIVFSKTGNGMEQGFIWFHKKDEQST